MAATNDKVGFSPVYLFDMLNLNNEKILGLANNDKITAYIEQNQAICQMLQTAWSQDHPGFVGVPGTAVSGAVGTAQKAVTGGATPRRSSSTRPSRATASKR